MFKLLKGSIALVLILGLSSGALVVGVEARGKFPGRASLAENYYTDDVSTRAIALDSNGNVYLAGYRYEPGNWATADWLIQKYDRDGNKLWITTYNGPANQADYARALAVDSSGNVYVTGAETGSGGQYDYATIKYDTNGHQLWVASYNGPGNLYDGGWAIALDASGNVYVTGYSDGGGSKLDFATIKYNNNGNKLWVERYNGPGNNNDHGKYIAVGSSGNIYVAGDIYSTSSNRDFAVIKYDPTGKLVWLRAYDAGHEMCQDMVIDANENIYVAGDSFTISYNYYSALVKWDYSGDRKWVSRYDIPLQSRIFSLAVDSASNIYATGYCHLPDNSSYGAVLKYDSNGSQLWETKYYGPGSIDGWCDFIGIDVAGNSYVAGGYYTDTADWDYALMKYDPNGNMLWEADYNNPDDGYDYPNALAVDSAGNVYITGYSEMLVTKGDTATLKYTSDGSLLWVTRSESTNQPPAADAGLDQTVTDNSLPLGTEQVTLNGSASTDPDGASDIASYIWAENNVQIASGVLPTVSLSVGTHTIVLTVTDQAGESSTDTVVVTVNPTNVAAMVQNILEDVAQLETENQAGLTGLLQAASNAYAGKKYNAAINMMKAFINLCNADSLLSAADRDRLIAKANNVIAIIQALHL